MDPVVVASDCRPGISDDDIAPRRPPRIRVFSLDDVVMLIGGDTTGRLLEIGVANAERSDFIIHAMPARPKFLR